MGGSAFQWMLHSHAMGGELHSRDTEDILGKVASAHEGGGSFGLNQTQIVIDFSQSLSLPTNTVEKYLIKKILQTLRKIFLMLC